MDFKDRLRLIDSLHNSKKVTPNQRSHEQKAASFTPNAAQISTKKYDCIDFSYAPDYRQGNILISNYFGRNTSPIHFLFKEPPKQEISLKKTLFLDTETTGLSGGVGTCAFLIGIGFLNKDNNSFTLRQFFMNDFDEEPGMLAEISEFAKQFDLLVTYNGKSYDIPLLNSRFIVNGVQSPFSELPHVDILHTVRRLWNHRMPDCSLLSAEKYIARKTREGDIPGFMIPYIFFEYLRSRNKQPLEPVFYHNREDVLTMVAVINEIFEMIESPFSKTSDSRSVLHVGRLYESRDQYEMAITLYEDFLKVQNDIPYKQDILIQLAMAHKKLNNWEHAKQTWQIYMESETFHPLPYIELAKHYEHKEKDNKAALTMVAKALQEMEIVYTLGRNAYWQDYKDDLKHRYKRLEKKVSGI